MNERNDILGHLYRTWRSMLSIAVPMLLSIIMASILHIFTGLSREHSNFVLATLRIIMASAPLSNTTDPLQLDNLAADWPMDVRTALTLLVF